MPLVAALSDKHSMFVEALSGFTTGCTIWRTPLVPNMGAGPGVAWDLREMGSAWVRGVREGTAPQEVRKISSRCSTRAETTWRRTWRNGQVGRDEEGSP